MVDYDGMEYSTEEEFEARINPEVLGGLDPSIRANLDWGLLARIVHTDPQTLAEVHTPWFLLDFIFTLITGITKG